MQQLPSQGQRLPERSTQKMLAHNLLEELPCDLGLPPALSSSLFLQMYPEIEKLHDGALGRDSTTLGDRSLLLRGCWASQNPQDLSNSKVSAGLTLVPN